MRFRPSGGMGKVSRKELKEATRARAEAMLVDLDTGRIVASPSFDWSPKTHSGNPDAARAGEAALAAGVQEFVESLRAELGGK